MNTLDLERSRGSALLMSVFVLALLTSMALILVFVSRTEVKMSEADLEAKQAYYAAEAATERGRELLRLELVTTKTSALTPRLDNAAGTNDVIDFDPSGVRPIYSGGAVVGFSGTGDDAPLFGPIAIGEGFYAAYLTNDPADGETNLIDTNDFVMITGLGVGPNGAFEVAQAIVQPGTLFPTIPATILLLGPTPDFKHASGKGWAGGSCPKDGSKYAINGVEVKGSKLYKAYNGTDCAPYRERGPDVLIGSKIYTNLVDVPAGGIPGLYMPTYGTVGPTAEAEVESEMKGSKIDYLSDLPIQTQVVRPDEPTGGIQDENTIADLLDATEPTVVGSGLGPLSPTWQDCAELKQIVETLRTQADYLCTPPGCSLPATTPSSISFIDGDFRIDCGAEGFGLLVVTGALDFPSSASWHGIVFVIGKGEFYRVKKDGLGNITGATVVASIAGPDDVYGTADDCTGGTNGFDAVIFRENKKAKGTTVYCTDDIAAADPGFREPTVRRSFRQQ